MAVINIKFANLGMINRFPVKLHDQYDFSVLLDLNFWDRLLGQGTDREVAAPSQSTIVLVQASGGIIAGATASCITTPLDTIKTRLQVELLVVES